MRQTIALIFILTLLVGQTYGQTDTGTVYRNLKTEKYYEVGLIYRSDNGQRKYEVNGKEVNKSTYRKYEKTWENMDNCCPCILKSYDENDILISEAVSCTDCYVGYFKEFYSNGQVKISGRYKENPTDNWDDIWNRGYCSVPDGQWIYYNEKGAILYSEYWKDGEFIKQIPEQNKTEIWKVDLTLNGENAIEKTLLTNQLKDLVITPSFKNATTDSVNLAIEFEVSATGRNYIKRTFTLDSFKLFDLKSLLLENGYKAQDRINYGLRVFNNQTWIASFYLKILADLPNSTESFYLNTLADLPNSTDSVINTIDLNRIIANNSDFYLINSIDSTKRVKLALRLDYELIYTEQNTDTLIEEKTITLQGYMVSLNQKAVNYNISTETVYLKLKDGLESRTINDYTSFEYSGNDNLRSINFKDLNYINYLSPSRNFFRTLGSATTVLSVLTTAIVAPLVSIDYKNGGFNKDRYFAFSGGGLIGLSVGIPLIAFSKPKTYKLTEKNSTRGKDLWYIQSQIKQ